MWGLRALRLGWFSTCWRAGAVVVVVGAPRPVVVLVLVPATVVVVVPATVVDVVCPDAAAPGSPVRTTQIVTAAPAATTRGRAARERITAGQRPNRDHQLFMPVPECE